MEYTADLFLIPDCNVQTQREMILSPSTNDERLFMYIFRITNYQ